MTENSLADAEDTAVFRNEILTEAKNDRINDFGRTRQWLSVIKKGDVVPMATVIVLGGT